MIKINRKTEYAIRGMIYLARQPRDQYVMIREITKATKTSPVFMAKIFQNLSGANLIVSSRGATGGLMLSRKPEHITLREIVEAIEGPVIMNLCVMDEKSCGFSKTCSAHIAWKKIKDSVSAMLEDVTLKDIAATPR
jgi:Rrf2 family transcriptional regulator, iron-sulfur cluster assembly transcription factor